MTAKLKISKRRKARARQSLRYWTKARMASAIPIPLRQAPGELLAQVRSSRGTKIVQPVPAQGENRVRADTNEVSDMTVPPYSWAGKLFMREGNNNYVGSAWVIGCQAIFSAAHCLYDDNGTFFDDVVFQPQYRNGNSLGSYAVVQSAVDERYTDFGNDYLNYDLGIGILDRPIGNETGVAGYAINPISEIELDNYVTGIGYPAGPPFDGSKMFKSRGQIVRDSAPGTTQERYYGAENDMTGGCSGGPWVTDNGVVVGLNSFVFVGERPQIMHSPYFGQGFADLIDWARDLGYVDGCDDVGGGTNDDSDVNVSTIRENVDQIYEALEQIDNEIGR